MLDFNFINARPQFRLYTEPGKPDAGLYYHGKLDRSLASIFNTLDEGGMVTGLRGNFAFFFYNQVRLVGAVDHMPTINLFYALDHDRLVCSHIYTAMGGEITGGEFDHACQAQARFFYGGSLGPDTFNTSIKRLESGTYFEVDRNSGKLAVKHYLDVYSHQPDASITVGDLSDIMLEIVEEQTRDQFNILWSSGKDSNCVMGFIRKLGRMDRCHAITLYSHSNTSDERPNVEYLARQYGIRPRYVDLGKYIGITGQVLARAADLPRESDYVENLARTWNGFWWEPNNFQKYSSVLDSGLAGNPTFTGEAGDQIFGSWSSLVIPLYMVQHPTYTSRDISEIFLKFSAWLFKAPSVKHPKDWLAHLAGSQTRRKAWDDMVDWITRQWDRIDTGGDITNKIELLHYFARASHRLYNYSQLVGVNFVHPFSDYRVFQTIFRTPGLWKKSHRRTRGLSLDLVRDHVDDSPWNVWKWKTGIYMPAAQAFNPMIQKELLRVIGPRH